MGPNTREAVSVMQSCLYFGGMLQPFQCPPCSHIAFRAALLL
ncbi:hypothetical protein M3J09_000043 [Ascochyta lentis]